MRGLSIFSFVLFSALAHAATIKGACTMRLDMPLSKSVFWYSYDSTVTGSKPVLCAVAKPVVQGAAPFTVSVPGQPDQSFTSRADAIAWAESQPK